MKLVRRSNNYYPSFPSVLDHFMSDAWTDLYNTGRTTTGSKYPAVNVQENENAYDLEVYAPGLAKENFNVEVNDGVLNISAEVKQDENENKHNYTRREYRHQSFSRSFTLPKDEVEVDAILANYENGVLKLSIPKREEAKIETKRVIEIA